MHALAQAGADVIELGVPFSDPMADGPVIQRASERALKAGVSLDTVLDYAREFRTRDDATAVVLMGYANPIEAMGVERFVERARGCRRRRRPRRRLPAGGVRAVRGAGEARRHGSHLPARADLDRVAHRTGGGSGERLRLLRFADRRHRRGAPRRRRRRREARRHPAQDLASARRRLRHPRRRDGAGDRRGRRRRGHRQPTHPGDGAGRAGRRGAIGATRFLAGIRAALDRPETGVARTA